MLDNIAVIILAAGSSNRLGRPKQLELYKGISLLQNTIDVALSLATRKVIVVLGARFEVIKSSILEDKITILNNVSWTEGMSTSLKCGLQYLVDNAPEVNKAIFMVCDQPYVNSSLLRQLIDTNLQTNKPIIASEYQGINGTPALFDQSMWSLLFSVEGDIGAGKIINQHKDQVVTIQFDHGEIDIDKEEDVEYLSKL